MTATDKVFAGSIPELYDRYLVPLIFEPCARNLAGRIAQGSPRNILETACGTGVLTRAMTTVLPGSRIVATDLNQPMIDQASTRLPGGHVTWRTADALALPFDDRSFDAVACQFGAMFFPDKIKGYSEARRVLRPGGRFCFNVWDKISENEFADVAMNALASIFPSDPPRFMARTPHGYHDTQKIRDELTAAGFTNISCDAVDEISKAASPRDVAIAYCQGTPWRNEIEARDASSLERATDITAEALAKKYGTGPIEGRIRAYAFTAS